MAFLARLVPAWKCQDARFVWETGTVEDNCHVVSTSTRNFPNRLGAGANVFLASARLLASVAAILGRLPTQMST